jgi:AAA15 family ATPase/GTPase
MIVSLRFKNFYSFQEEVTIDFENPKADKKDELYAHVAGYSLSKALMVVGANASGKSNVLRAFAFLLNFISNSFSEKPDTPLTFKPYFSNIQNTPTEFTLKFLLDKTLYRYELKVIQTHVLEECLYAYSENSQKPNYLFKRKYDELKNAYNYKDKGFKFDKKLALQTRKNASIISTAKQYDIELARKIYVAIGMIIFSNINSDGTSFEFDLYKVSELFHKQKEHFEKVKNILKHVDLGLSDVEIISNVNAEGKETYFPIGIHQIGDKIEKLPFIFESKGTQTLYCKLFQIICLLEIGGLIVMDELDTELHIDMLDHILRLFLSEKTNPHHAQIIFTSHILEPMNILDKHQIVLTEKNHNASEAFNIAEIEGLRSDENIYKRYKAGAYGAVPKID